MASSTIRTLSVVLLCLLASVGCNRSNNAEVTQAKADAESARAEAQVAKCELAKSVAEANTLKAELAKLKSPAPSDDGPPRLTRDEVLGYLDGKTIAMPLLAQTPQKDTKEYVLRRDQIESLQVGTDRTNLAANCDRVWFVVNADGVRFAVRTAVESQLIEGRRAFFMLHVLEAARQ